MLKPNEFADWQAVCEVKARYCRLLDTKQWDAWAKIFTEDLVLDTSEAGGPPPITGRDAAIASVREVIETARTAHQVHNPEVTVDGDTASVIWAMQDRVAFADGKGFVGYGHYIESYVRLADGWRIASVKLTRLHIDPLRGHQG